ncbi:22804_t:CDS:2, partial [Gigaspora margarita]
LTKEPTVSEVLNTYYVLEEHFNNAVYSLKKEKFDLDQLLQKLADECNIEIDKENIKDAKENLNKSIDTIIDKTINETNDRTLVEIDNRNDNKTKGSLGYTASRYAYKVWIKIIKEL